MKKIVLLLFGFIFIFCNEAYSGLLGGALTYKYESSSGTSSTYIVSLELYTSCEGLAGSPEILVKKDGIIVNRPVLNFVSGSVKDISPICAANSDETSCGGSGYYAGVKKYTFSGKLMLDGPSANWSFVFFGYMSDTYDAMMSQYIDNATVINEAPSEFAPITSDVIYLDATLNNTTGPNSSVIYTSPPIPFYCQGFKSYYGFGAVDDDFDQLQYSLIPARADKMNLKFGFLISEYLDPSPIPTRYHDPPFSGLKPLPVDPDSFYLNPSSGQMIFTPNTYKNCLVAVRTDEYRNGVVVGSTMREMTFFIYNDCSSPTPNPTVLNVRNADHAEDPDGNDFFKTCEGLVDTASFDIHLDAPDNGNVDVTADYLPFPATITIDGAGTPNALAHVKWNAIDVLPGSYNFYLTFSNNTCPFNARRNVGYTFTVVPHNITFESGFSGSCASASDGKAWVVPNGENTIDYTYKWTDTATGNVLRDVSSKIGDTLSNVPVGIYKVYVRNTEGCGKNFFIKVDTTLVPQIRLPKDSSVCLGMPIHLDGDTAALSPETYAWSTGSTECCILARETGNYILTAQNHCGSSSDSVYLNFVKCNYCLFIPNAFTPNGDGSNDVFHVTPTCLIYKYKIQIFNRWGQLVYVSYSLYDDWNGTFGGRQQEQGAYYYSIEAVLDNENKDKLFLRGDITMIK
jgi:gliding motility-associated-like protein